MKKIILIAMSLFMISSLALAAEPAVNSEEEATASESTGDTVAESTVAQAPTGISKGDSFMLAFGMGDSSIVSGGESGGTSGSAGLNATVAGTVAGTGSTSLTSSQNTPYYYKY